MKIDSIKVPQDLQEIISVTQDAFADGSDSSLSDWLSFKEIEKQISIGKGICLKAIDESGKILGITYAEQERPVNGREGLEKWVVILAAVLKSESGKGIGSQLLSSLEESISSLGGVKIFIFTNEGDEQVINFYKKNGYRDVGRIENYQYGKGNSAVFLLKYL